MTDVQGSVRAEGGNLQLISWNVKGLGSSIKRGKVIYIYIYMHVDVCMYMYVYIQGVQNY